METANNTVDDVIKYIGDSLDKHKGCDILDINPGAGLWSQKLHEYLKPRSHVLLEPRYDAFRPFLEPLLTAKGSKYTLLEDDPCNLGTYRDIVDNQIFPHQTIRDRTDPRAQEQNNTLLVTGSLVWDPILPGLRFDSMAKQLFYHLANTAWSNDLLHSYGLTRSLFWANHDDFDPLLAGSIAGLQKGNRFLEMTHNLNQIVVAGRTGRKVGKGSTGREPQYDIESALRAIKSGRDKGKEVPLHRRTSMHEFATDIDRMSDGTGICSSITVADYLHEQQLAGKDTVGLLQDSVIELYNTELRMRQEFPDLPISKTTEPNGEVVHPVHISQHPAAKDLQVYYKKRSLAVYVQRIKLQVEAIADIGEDMYELECEILKMSQGPNKDRAMLKLEQLEQEYQVGLAKISPNYAYAPAHAIDDRIAMRTPPYPRLQWDQRPYEPLLMHSDEVWPQNRLLLMSAEPKPRLMGPTSDWSEWIQDFIYGLYRVPAESIEEALEKMQHGLSSIIENCPSLRDPQNGGRLLMRHLRVRVLTPEMVQELAKAYKDWPFKAPGSDYNKYFRHKNLNAEFA